MIRLSILTNTIKLLRFLILALSAAGAGNTVVNDNDVAELGACIVESAVDFTVDDDTAANACAEGDHYRILGALCSTCNCLAESGGVCIVVDAYFFDAGALGEHRADGECLEWKI